MKRTFKTFGLAVIGIIIIISAFFYDVMFAGIPYQDPMAELQKQWDLNKSIADWLYKSGGVVLLLGLLLIPILWKKRDAE